MAQPNGPNSNNNKQIRGYNRMLERVKEFLAGAEEDLASKFHYAVDSAKEKASELGELTREESEEIADYLKRDVHDAAQYLAEEGAEIGDWLRFDVQLVEAKLLDWMSHAVDTTRIEYQQLAEQAKQENIWLAGEVTGPGTLQCTQCGHELEFHDTQQIPKCPECNNEQYKRFSSD